MKQTTLRQIANKHKTESLEIEDSRAVDVPWTTVLVENGGHTHGRLFLYPRRFLFFGTELKNLLTRIRSRFLAILILK